MRRFIVIFLLLLLPTQVLAEALANLRAPAHRVVLPESTRISSMPQASVKLALCSPCADCSGQTQKAHADLSDTVNTASLCLPDFPPNNLWPGYRPVGMPSVYLPVIKPPLI